MSGEHSVYQFFPDVKFPDDNYERVLQHVDAKTSVEKARALTLTVGARIGTTRRVIITDGDDSTNFEWKFG